jgi:hypothetical protein
MALSVAEANAIADYQFNQSSPTSPAVLYMSLHTAAPGTTGASEVTDGTYARQLVTTAFGNASNGVVTNTAVIEFPAATTGFTATHGGVWSAATAGTYYRDLDISPDKVVGAGEILRFATSSITYTVA